MSDKSATDNSNPLPKSWGRQLTGSALSLRIFERPEEIFRLFGFLPGDFAEIAKGHCSSSETGLLVRISKDHYVRWHIATCADCGQHMREYWVDIVPVRPDHPIALKWETQAPGGPWSYPIAWLKKWEAHQVSPQDVKGA